MKALHTIAWILLVIGGLNWLLVVFGWELGTNLFGGMDSTLSRAVYFLVGVSAIFEIITHRSNCKMCMSSGDMTNMTERKM